jgi:chromosome segregation ATPase
VSLNLIPARYRNRHRGKTGLQLQRELTQAEDKATSLTAALDQALAELTDLREENAALRNLKAGADDTFVIQLQVIDDLEGDVRRHREELAAEQGARAVAEKDVETRGRWIEDLEGKVADLERRLDIRALAEAAAARTQEIPVITRVLPLPESPLTAVDTAQLAALKARGDGGVFGPVTNPGHVATT